MASDPDQPNAQFTYSPGEEPIGTEPEGEGDVEGMIDETVGEIKPWQEVEIVLDGWQYRVWDKWLGGEEKTANLLLDVVKQYDSTATMQKEHSKTNPESPDTVYAYYFSLYGNPDGVMEAVTDIQEVFLALENYKVIAGKASAIIKYPDGDEELLEVPTKGGTDIDEALDYVIDSFAKSLGSKGEQEQGQAWTPGYQAVPKALKSAPNNEPETPLDLSKIKRDADTYGKEMTGLIDTLITIGNDPTATPEAIEKSSKVAEDRVKDIVDWASDVSDRISEEAMIDDQAEDVMDSIQKILEYGSRLQMLLIGTKEGAKQTAEMPLPEPELELPSDESFVGGESL